MGILSIAPSWNQQSFLISGSNLATAHSRRSSARLPTAVAAAKSLHDSSSPPLSKRKHQDEKEEVELFRMGKQVAIAVLAAGVLTLTAAGDASAAKSGGRIGGQSFRSSQPPPSRSSPRINNNNSSSRSRTNIYVNPPPIAPPLGGGYGYGYGSPFYGGGWGWSPFSFFAPAPTVAVGVGGGFDTLALFLFLGAGAAVIRRFLRSFRDRDED
ncbi:hypothetical protein LINGRAHAP2_LOCUS26453 [Linum grandiflorum]